MIAVTSLVIVVYAQEAAHEDLELAETKGKKLTRHIQHNNRPSQPRFRPRIRTSGKSGRGRSDSSENGGSNGGDEYDANDGNTSLTVPTLSMVSKAYVHLFG